MSARIYIPRLATRGLVAPRTGALPPRPPRTGCGGPACGIRPRTGGPASGGFPPILIGVDGTIGMGDTASSLTSFKFKSDTRIDQIVVGTDNADAVGALTVKYCNRTLFDAVQSEVLGDQANIAFQFRQGLGLFVPAGQEIEIAYTANAAVGAARIVNLGLIGVQGRGCAAGMPSPQGSPNGDTWAGSFSSTIAMGDTVMAHLDAKFKANTDVDDIVVTTTEDGRATAEYCNRVLLSSIANVFVSANSVEGPYVQRPPMNLSVPAGQEVSCDYVANAAAGAAASVFFTFVGRQNGCA